VREAEKIKTRFLNQVDEKRSSKRRATVDQLMAKYFEVVDVDALTLRRYRSKYNNQITPLLGKTQLSKLGVEVLDSSTPTFAVAAFTVLAKSSFSPAQLGLISATNKRATDARATTLRDAAVPTDVQTALSRGLSDSTVRQIHWILSGALDRAVVWS
jgi:hypothetical protein